MTVKLRERMTEKGPEWIADIRVRLPSGVVHRERRRAEGSSKSAALRWAREREAYLIRNGPETRQEVETRVPTLDEFTERFMEHADVNNKPSAAYAKKRIIARELSPAFGKRRLDEILSADVERYKAAAKKRLNPKTINNNLIVLGRMLSLAMEWELLKAAPKIKALPLPEQPFEFLDFEESDRLLAAVTSEWRVMVTTAIKTGLRPGEVRALKWEDIDLSACRLIVRRTLWRGREGSPKGGKSREVPLCDTALSALKAHRPSTALRGRYVFSPAAGERPFSETEVRTVVADSCKRAGLAKRLNWHGLRHTFASHLVMRGVPLKAVQELMGHATIDMTMRYAHLAPDVRRDAVRVLDGPAPSWQPGGNRVEASEKS